jgi:hypothetical protein
MPLLANPLHKYATHNYVWSLSAMYPGELNDPRSYRNNNSDGKIIIASSGGVGNRKTIITAAENKVGSNVEFHIDNVRISSNPTPNKQSPVSNNTIIDFTITEPYSLGLFIQSLSQAALRAGFKNYVTAPYLLTLKFKGFKDDGTPLSVIKKSFVIKINTVSFTADTGGSTYEISSNPFNHTAFGSVAQSVKENISLKGSTVAELLSLGESSLERLLNSREESLVNENKRIVADQYRIRFPLDIATEVGSPNAGGFSGGTVGNILNTVQNGLNKVDTALAAVNTLSNSVSNLGSVVSNFSNNSNVKQLGSVISSISGAIDINDSSGSAGEQNEIGAAKLIDDFTEFGTEPFQTEIGTWDPEKQIFTRGSMTLSGTDKTYTFHAGTMIEDVIQQIALISKFGQGLQASTVDKAGMFRYFRIHAKVEIISLDEIDNIGRPALRYIYEVYPYFIHQSVVSLPDDKIDASVLVDDAVKAYNYMYTGLNRDILDFEIDLNNVALRLSTLVDDGQRNPSALSSVGSTVVAKTNTVLTRRIATGSSGNLSADAIAKAALEPNAFQSFTDDASQVVAELRNIFGIFGGAGIDNNRTRVAQLFKKAIEDKVTLATLNLTILGDPYFLSDSDMGNYVSPALNPFITQNLDADFARSQVYVLVKFNSAVDYKQNTLAPDPADMFTGIYEVNIIESIFENGTFKQVLNMNKVKNISASSISRLKSVVDSFFATLGAVSTLAGLVGATGVSSKLNGFMVDAAPVANSLLGLAQAGDTFKGAIQSGDFSNIGGALDSLDSFFASASALETQYRNFANTLNLPNLTLPKFKQVTPASIANLRKP